MSKIKLVAIVPFYNDFKALQRLLLYLSSMDIPSILCDGRFHDFKKLNNSDLSTDGSRFLISSFKNSSLIDLEPCKIQEKINRLFQEASKNGYTHVLLLGCDEYLVGDKESFLKNLENIDSSKPLIIKIPFEDDDKTSKDTITEIERIFYLPGKITARSHNSFFYSDDATDISQDIETFPETVTGISIHHDNSIRKMERNELMKEYQKKIKESEF